MSEMDKRLFCMDSIPGIQFQGFTDGDTWNGFACPYFELEEAKRILQASVANGYNWSYNEKQDAFLVRSFADPRDYESEVFSAVIVETLDHVQRKVYGIGAYSWIWSECSKASAILHETRNID